MAFFSRKMAKKTAFYKPSVPLFASRVPPTADQEPHAAFPLRRFASPQRPTSLVSREPPDVPLGLFIRHRRPPPPPRVLPRYSGDRSPGLLRGGLVGTVPGGAIVGTAPGTPTAAIVSSTVGRRDHTRSCRGGAVVGVWLVERVGLVSTGDWGRVAPRRGVRSRIVSGPRMRPAVERPRVQCARRSRVASSHQHHHEPSGATSDRLALYSPPSFRRKPGILPFFFGGLRGRLGGALLAGGGGSCSYAGCCSYAGGGGCAYAGGGMGGAGGANCGGGSYAAGSAVFIGTFIAARSCARAHWFPRGGGGVTRRRSRMLHSTPLHSPFFNICSCCRSVTTSHVILTRQRDAASFGVIPLRAYLGAHAV